jgi:hypothetical protein
MYEKPDTLLNFAWSEDLLFFFGKDKNLFHNLVRYNVTFGTLDLRIYGIILTLIANSFVEGRLSWCFWIVCIFIVVLKATRRESEKSNTSAHLQKHPGSISSPKAEPTVFHLFIRCHCTFTLYNSAIASGQSKWNTLLIIKYIIRVIQYHWPTRSDRKRHISPFLVHSPAIIRREL